MGLGDRIPAGGALRMKGQLPKAYLRIDPNLDMTHPDPGEFVKLLCAAARQPKRGRFKSWALFVAAVGKREAKNHAERGDVCADGIAWIVDGWDIWQEGDMTVGERVRRFRDKHRVTPVTSPLPVTPETPLPPSEASGVRRKERKTTETDLRPVAAEFPSKRAANVYLQRYPDGEPPGAMFKALRPLVQKHGWEVVEPELVAYLEQTAISFHSWPKFAGGFGTWANGDSRQAVNPKARERMDGFNAMIRGGLKGDGRGLGAGDERPADAAGSRLAAGGSGAAGRNLPEAPPVPDGPSVAVRGQRGDAS